MRFTKRIFFFLFSLITDMNKIKSVVGEGLVDVTERESVVNEQADFGHERGELCRKNQTR